MSPASTVKTAQLNVRMDKPLHDTGNARLLDIGLTPSKAVRALWEKAAKGGKDLEEVRVLLLPDCEQVFIEQDLALVEEGWNAAQKGLEKLGIDTSQWPLADFPSHKELEEQARVEDLIEAGFVL